MLAVLMLLRGVGGNSHFMSLPFRWKAQLEFLSFQLVIVFLVEKKKQKPTLAIYQ